MRFTKLQFLFYNLMFISLFFILGYLYQPYRNYDLFRYFVEMNLLSRYSYLDSFSVGVYANEPLIHTVFYIIGKIGNFSLLSSTAMGTITTLIVLAGYKIIYNKNYNFANYSFFLYFTVVIGMIGIVNTMSGISQILAWSFALIAINYDYFSQNKNKIISFLLYLIPLGIHSSSIILLLIRVFTIVFKKRSKSIWLIILWPISLSIIALVYDYLPSYFQYLTLKLELYTSGTIEISIWQTIIRIIILIILLVWTLKKDDSEENIQMIEYKKFYLVLLLFPCSSIFASTMFGRMTSLILLASFPNFDKMIRNRTLVGWLSVVSILIITFVNFVISDFFIHGQWFLYN
ncbi:EpsG family protein [Aerococcus urinaeequi]|uniref:EpsG family protein n=1 Tax=Aerococcus urinaeequi TaxID=51665 RepID=UPI003D6BF36D